MADNTVGTAYAVVVTAVADPMQVEGLEWDRAVEYLPSIDSRSMQKWVRAQEAGARRGVVIPGPHRRAAPRHPYREICVPSAEYQLFSAAVRTNRRRALATTCPEDEARQRARLLSTAH
ncbi:hypothetical protein [Nocardia seriolae]|uniref:Uncharacterized protein n=1 Tax=Nocardia seriolae TaxID=37332 RepID=A0ABC9YQS4_9NOCA|nr:hypothetical protein [Nocardia seriolae]APA96899.1 hypothetical protein NS506_02839 [Nocardia seriolae]OJF81991.1 hypothetical protein NS14008_26005 [Nocardia seriolae]QOW33920.1 hypothetical protein IMZ23_01840 [Nocardia seriolae]QUN18584.1 hypothetical protein KEC46_03890 [Nocardia seriolae]WKY54284.1 hypothetical protein Q5P07_09680 [Nocardia seriolae]